MKQYREALSACEDVLQKDPDNVKALYRAGRVLAHMGELEEAVHKLQRALSKSPEDKTIQTELKRTFKKKEQTLKQEKAMYKRMMEPEPPSKPQSSPQRDTTWVSVVVVSLPLRQTPIIAGTMALHVHCRHHCCRGNGNSLFHHPKTLIYQ